MLVDYAQIQKILSGGGGGVGGGGGGIFSHPRTMFFTEVGRDLPREAIGPKGSNCFSRGVITSIFRETYTCNNL